MFVSTGLRTSWTPSISANPASRNLALAWSSASRSTLMLEGVDTSGGDDPRLTHRPAEPVLQQPRLRSMKSRVPGQHRADRRPQPLREVDPDRIDVGGERLCRDARWRRPRSSAAPRPCASRCRARRPAPAFRPVAPAARPCRPPGWWCSRPRSSPSRARACSPAVISAAACSAVKTPRTPSSVRIIARPAPPVRRLRRCSGGRCDRG